MKFLNPIKIIAGWVLLMIIINIIVVPILFYKTVGGEQRPLIFLMTSIDIMAYGIFILSILTIVLYFSWVKKFWFVNLFFILASAIYVFKEQKYNNEIKYSFNERIDSIGNSEIKTRLEYYSLKPSRLRSQRYWKDGKKDSLWTIYSEKGNVLNQERYKNDVLIEVLK